jgi:predicted nicotinamide N-methyase
MARRSAIYLVAAFTSGAFGAVLLIATLALAAGRDIGAFIFGATAAPWLVAAYALGLLIGPLPVARLLLRVGPATLLLAAVVASSVIAVAIVISQTAIFAVLLLIPVGLAKVTEDVLRAVAIRRLVPVHLFERVTHLSLLALTAGQIYGAVGVVSLSRAPDPYAILVVLAISQVVLIGFGIALGGRSSLRVGGLSNLPIKSVVHKLSWDTRPPAKPQDLGSASPRAQRLARWLNRRVELQELRVTLPVSKREYVIYRPDDVSRERLFEQGRADPDKQMPYWAKVWPSGVALADVVVERKEEVADQHVLELGAGLGVTACAVLEYGGHIVTADYSALPLAHCRLNTLVNTDRAPRATCFNWRHAPEVAAAIAQPEFRGGFPLIIAGDVLYEGRDAEPLLNVIDEMLVADGSLWLAEPVRKTAQRFLDSAASLGWQIESRQVTAEWPDATDGPVNLHFLNRSTDMDHLSADLGGWRI